MLVIGVYTTEGVVNVSQKVAERTSILATFDANKVGQNDHGMYLVEFRFPNASANTWVLARRHFKGYIEVGNPTDSRGGKVFHFVPVETTQFNVNGCTGRIKPHNDTR